MAKLEIIVDAEVKEAQKELEGFNDELGNTEKQADKQNAAFGSSAVSLDAMIGIAKEAVEVIKQIYATAREGAELEFLEGKFENLAESIGTTADVLLDELKVATKGTLSDMEAMALATDLVGLGLANDAKEAVRMARVVAGLGADMNQLTLTLTNMTTMRFDAIGVRVDGFKDRLAGLEEQGMDTSKAFTEAFLQQAEEQLDLVGNAADSTLGTFQKLEARAKNTGNAFKRLLTDAVEPSIKKWVEYAEAIDEGREAHERMTGVIITGRAYAQNREEINASILANEEWLASIDATTSSWDHFQQTIVDDVLPPTGALVSKFGGLLEATRQAGDSISKYEEQQGKTADKTEELNIKIAEATLQYGAQSQQVLELKNDLLELGEQEAENTRTFEENTNKRILKRAEEMLAVGGLTVAEEEFLLRQGLAMGLYTEEYVLEAGRVIQETQKMVDDFNALDGKRVSVFVTSFLNTVGVSEGGLSNMPGFADGGIARGPESGHLAMLHGNEAVIPLQNGAVPVSLGRGGGVTVNLTINSAVSLATQEEAENVLTPFIIDGIRTAQANGQIQ